MQTLDIPERQALLGFFGDANGLNWHDGVLLQQGPEARWVVGTPDLEVEQADLGTHRVIPLNRAAPFLRRRQA